MNFFGRTVLMMGIAGLLAVPAVYASADDTDTSQPTLSQSTDGSTIGKVPSQAKSQSSDSQSGAAIDNTRMQSYVGSKSKWSGHFNFSYYGGAVNDPLSASAPNPTNVYPAPPVYMTGTMALQDRISDSTSLALGTGIQVMTPFQSLKSWETFNSGSEPGISVSDPYVGYNKLLNTGKFQHYLELQATGYTDSFYAGQFGYIGALSLNDQSYIVLHKLTLGMNFWAQGNLVSTADQFPAAQQDVWFIGGGPYAEYAFSERLSLRTVLGIEGDHYRNLPGADLSWENIYQTLGLGYQVIKGLYVYAYALASPYSGNFTASNTQFGFNTIINVF